MNCKKFKTLLPEYLYGEISDRNRNIFLGHAAVCSSCRKLMTETEGLVLLLKSRPAPEISPAELSSWRARVKEEIARREVELRPFPRRNLLQLIFQPRFIPAAVFLVALLAGGAVLLRPPGPTDYGMIEEVSELVKMTETIEKEFQNLAELSREIDNLRSLFPEEPESGSGAEIIKPRKIVPA
jgi:hypothetical protein